MSGFDWQSAVLIAILAFCIWKVARLYWFFSFLSFFGLFSVFLLRSIYGSVT